MANKSKRIDKEVLLRKVDSYQVPDSLIKLRDLLNEMIEEIPEEFQPSAEGKLSHESYGDSTDVEIRITYKRPETDNEMANRLHFEDVRKEQAEDRELMELRRLQAKYPRFSKPPAKIGGSIDGKKT